MNSIDLIKSESQKHKTFKPELQNFLDPGLAKPQCRLNLVFKNTDQVKHNRITITHNPGLV